MPATILPSIIGAAGSIGGALFGRPSSSQTSLPQRDPQQMAMHNQLAQILQDALASGPSIPRWAKNAGQTNINEQYNATIPRAESYLASRGMDTSGKMGSFIQSNELQRNLASQKLMANLRDFAQQRYQNYLDRAQRFQQPEGFQSTYQGQSPWPSAIGGLSGDIASGLWLRQLGQRGPFGGGTSGGGGGDSMYGPGGPV